MNIHATTGELFCRATRSDVQALGPVERTVAERESVCLFGPSWCWKSTCLRIVAGLVNPSRGSVEIAPREKSRAAVAFEAGKPLEIVEVDLDGPKAGEVLIEIKATGICHTDEFTLSGSDPEGRFPAI